MPVYLTIPSLVLKGSFSSSESVYRNSSCTIFNLCLLQRYLPFRFHPRPLSSAVTAPWSHPSVTYKPNSIFREDRFVLFLLHPLLKSWFIPLSTLADSPINLTTILYEFIFHACKYYLIYKYISTEL